MQINLERSWNSHNYLMFLIASEKACASKRKGKVKLFNVGGFVMKEIIQKTKMGKTVVWNNIGCETTRNLDFILWAELHYWRYWSVEAHDENKVLLRFSWHKNPELMGVYLSPAIHPYS